MAIRRKHHHHDDDLATAGGSPAPRRPEEALHGLQQAAGNAAVATLVRGSAVRSGAAPAVQRAAAAVQRKKKASDGYVTLTVGHKHMDVETLRALLDRSGYHREATGDPFTYDQRLAATVRQFQMDMELPVTGVCGDVTWRALGARFHRSKEPVIF